MRCLARFGSWEPENRTLLSSRTVNGQRQAERGAASELAFDGDTTAVRLNRVLDDREADAAAAGRPGLVGFVKALEDPRQVGGVDAVACVMHPDDHLAVAAG